MHGLGRPFQKGQSGNLNGRPKGSLTLPEVRKALTPHASKFIETLVSLLEHSDPRAQLRAVELGMGYLWGKPQERPAGELVQPPSQHTAHELMEALTHEQRRTVVEWLAANAKAEEAAGMEPPALPNARVMLPTAHPQPAAAAVENGRSETLPPTSLPFGNWK